MTSFELNRSQSILLSPRRSGPSSRSDVIFRLSGKDTLIPPAELIERMRRAIAANQEVSSATVDCAFY